MAATTSGKDKILRWSRLYVAGYDLSGDTRTVGQMDNFFGEAPTNGISDAVYNFLADKRRRTGISGVQVLLNDTAATGAHTLLKQAAGTPADSVTLVSWLFGGGGVPVAGDPAYTLAARQMADTASFDSNIGVLQASFLQDQTSYDANVDNPAGVLLTHLDTISATTNYASADYGAVVGTTTKGWQAILHVSATSSGDYAIVIEDSTDDSAWATLGTFTADASAITSEHLTGAGNVDRYVRVTATRTAGTAVLVITFARNY